MKFLKSFRKVVSVLASTAVIFNSFAPNMLVLAQEITPTPAPTEESTPAPTDSATLATPAENPTVSPDATPSGTESPAPEATATPTDLITPAPSDTPIATQAPESNPTVQGPPASDDQAGSTTLTPSPSAQPTATPQVPVEHGTITETVIDGIDLSGVTGLEGTIITDKPDYSPTSMVLITGIGFLANKTYTIEIVSTDQPPVDFTDQIKADSTGNITYAYQLDGTMRPNYTVYIKVGETVVATTTFTDPESVKLEQCRNGSAASPNNCLDLAGPDDGWVSGNAGSSQAHYVEGYSIPYRAVLEGLPTATSITLTLAYDIKHSDKHAIDYLTHYDRLQPHTAFGHSAETISPTDGVTGISATTTTFPIPTPSSTGSPVAGQPTTSFNNLPDGERVMTLFGGTITNVAYVSQGDLTASNASTQISVTFTVNSTNAVLAWGGHIGSRLDWEFVAGVPRSAGGISGSPYHMNVVSWTLGSLGNQDRSLSAGAVISPSNITIRKVTSPAGGTGFGFTTTGGILPATFSLNAGGNQTFSAAPGTYSISENDPSPAYTLSNLTCAASGTGTSASPNIPGRTVSIVIGAGGAGSVDCTFTNSLQQAHLTLVKTVTKDNGGTALATDWTLSAGGPTPISGVTGNSSITAAPVNAGDYTLSESGGPTTGYSAGNWSCDAGTLVGSTVTLAPGDNATCTINNNDNAPSLTLTKIVSNTHGGTAVATEWDLTASGPTTITGAGGTTSGATFKAGTYTLSESLGPVGYTPGSWNCTGATVTNSQITLSLGQSASCSITNSDKAPSLTLIKTVTKDNGGTALASAWTLTATGNLPSPTNLTGNTPVSSDSFFKADTYTLGESGGPSGYTPSLYSCVKNDGNPVEGNSITLELGDTAICTINNDDNAPSLTLNKILIKDNGGTASESAWTLTADGGQAGTLSGSGALGDTDVVSGTLFQTGTYTLSESTGPGGYSASDWTCTGTGTQIGNQITLGLGQSAVCSITNDDIAPLLTVTKNVIDQYGGGKVASDFTMGVTGTNVSDALFPGDENGTTVTLDVGTYSVNEIGKSGYLKSIGTNCSGSIALGEHKYCTITNTAIPATITVDKITNPSSSTDLFTFDLSGTGAGSTQLTDASPAYTFPNLSVGTYSLTEQPLAGWDSTGVSCTLNGQTSGNISISLGLADSLSCTFTNTQKGHLVVQKTTLPAGEQTVFDISATGSGTITGGGTGTVTDTLDKNYEVTPGTYSVSETEPTGWKETGNTCTSVVVGAGETKYCEITNTKLGNVIVQKTMVGGVGSFTFTGDVAGTISTNNGTFQRHNVLPGNYSATESATTGWKLTDISCNDMRSQTPSTFDLQSSTAAFNVDPGETVTCTFTNTKYGYMQGRKYSDTNMDGRLENTETFLNGWTIRLYDSEWQPIASQITGNNGLLQGQYRFGNLLPGTYYACEVLQNDYQQTGPIFGNHAVDYNNNQVNNSVAVNNGSDATDEAPICWQSNINGDEFGWLGFGNVQKGHIIVRKVTNVESEDEFGFRSNFTEGNFYLTSGGEFESDLIPGTYSVSELDSKEWRMTSATCSDRSPVDRISLQPGETITCTFNNTKLDPKISIVKSNNSGSGINAGSNVIYTLSISNNGNVDFTDVLVTDFLPGGFTYIDGSTTGATFINAVGSKLTWNLDSLVAGETATITYHVTTNSALTDGDYLNFATCLANYGEGQTKECDQVNSTVKISHGISYGGNLFGQVLGISTELPATGSPTLLLIASLGLFGTGLFLNGYNKKRNVKN